MLEAGNFQRCAFQRQAFIPHLPPQKLEVGKLEKPLATLFPPFQRPPFSATLEIGNTGTGPISSFPTSNVWCPSLCLR